MSSIFRAEQDARLAKVLASRDSEKAKKQPLSPSHARSEQTGSLSPRLSPPQLLQHVTAEVTAHAIRTRSPLLGAAAAVASVEKPGPSRACYQKDAMTVAYTSHPEDEEDMRRMQEDKDAVSICCYF